MLPNSKYPSIKDHLSNVGGLLSKLSLGVQAKAPAQNLSTPTPTIPSSQAKQNVQTMIPKSSNPLTSKLSPAQTFTPAGKPITNPLTSTFSPAQTFTPQNNNPLGTNVANAQNKPVVQQQQKSNTYVPPPALQPQQSQPSGYGVGVNDYNQYTDKAPQYTPVNPSPDVLGNTGTTPQPQQTAPVQQPYTVNDGLYGQLIASLANRSNQSSEDYQAAQQRLNDIAKQQSDIAQEQAQKTYQIGARTGDVAQATGEQGLLNQLFASRQAALAPQYSAASTALGAANTQQGLQYGALGNAITAAAPQAYGLTQQPFNPATGQFGGSQSVGQRAEQAANIQSIQDLSQQKSQIQSIFNGADANFKLLLDTAQQGGVNNGDIPALNALQQNVSRGLTSNSAVINFQNTLAAVRSLYAQILGGGTTTVDSQNRAEQAIPNNISLNALRSLGTQLESESVNRIAGMTNQIKSLQGSQNESQSGNIWSF